MATRAKMSAAGKGRVFSEQHRSRIGIGSKGKKKPCSPSRRQKIIASLTGKKHTPERVENMRNALIALRQEVPQVFSKSKGTSQYKGVAQRGIRWRARLRFKGRDINLGQFGTEVEAATAYDTAARQYLGQFALLNFPNENERGALRGGAIGTP